MPMGATIYQEDIAKPALVLVHGLGSAGTIWKSLIPQLIDTFTIYAIDLPGHGSAALEVDEKLDPQSLGHSILEMMRDEYGVHSMHVAGNSVGGWIALEMGAISPTQVASVTALAPAGLWQVAPTRKFPPSLDARFLAKITQFFMRTAYRLPVLKAIGYKKITHLWRELSFETCKDSVLAMARSKGYMPMWSGLRGRRFDSKVDKKVSVSIIFGDYDLTLPESIAQKRAAAPEHADWIVVDNCAHVIMWNYPNLTVDFIKRTAQLT